MNDWTPTEGERVLAVLPDGHEIEGEYDFYACPQGPEGPPGFRAVHVVVVGQEDYRETVSVRTVKPVPVPVTEPMAQLARIIDGDGTGRFRWGHHWYVVGSRTVRDYWCDLPQPVTIVDADPDWGQQ